VDLPRNVEVTKKRLAWLRETLHDEKKHTTPNDTFRERKRPHIFSSYITLISHIIDSKPSSYQEKQVAAPVVRKIAPSSNRV
jgi:hypothetical protein